MACGRAHAQTHSAKRAHVCVRCARRGDERMQMPEQIARSIAEARTQAHSRVGPPCASLKHTRTARDRNSWAAVAPIKRCSRFSTEISFIDSYSIFNACPCVLIAIASTCAHVDFVLLIVLSCRIVHALAKCKHMHSMYLQSEFTHTHTQTFATMLQRCQLIGQYRILRFFSV